MRIITREDIAKLKLQRKKQLKRLWITSIVSAVIVIVVVLFVMHEMKGADGASDNDTSNSVEEINTTEVNTPTDIETSEELTTELTTEEVLDVISTYDFYDKYVASATDADYEYEVPENSLPDIAYVVGNDWVPEKKFTKNEGAPIPLNYFDDAVFIGDSRTEGLLLYAGLGNLNGICYKGLNVGVLDSEKCISVKGQKEKITCYEAISNNKYNFYYCMFGVNELGWVDVDAFIDYFSALIDHIYSVNPDAIVYVENVMPVTRKLEEEDETFALERINEYNEKLLAMCKERNDVIYLDVFSAVADDYGYLPDDASPDGVHCGVSYCMRVIEYIRMNTYTRIK